jgi:hypothetical protein
MLSTAYHNCPVDLLGFCWTFKTCPWLAFVHRFSFFADCRSPTGRSLEARESPTQRDTEEYQTSFTPHANEIIEDIPKYMNSELLVQIGEVKLYANRECFESGVRGALPAKEV